MMVITINKRINYFLLFNNKDDIKKRGGKEFLTTALADKVGNV